MPNCTLCFRPFKTCGTLAKHQRLFHDRKSAPNNDEPPPRFTLTFFVNKVWQTLSCPVCHFTCERCRNVKSIVSHFQKQHPFYQLCISYLCKWCHQYIDPAEIRVHAHAHFEQFALHQPFSPLVPQINLADNSLSFLDDKNTVVDPENISDDVVPDTPPECAQASTPSHVDKDVISNTTELIEACDFMDFVDDVIPNSSLDAVDPFISINVDDSDLDKLVNTDDLTISSPGVVVSPSYKKVLLREPSPNQSIHSDILFPSPLSPELLDPSHDSSHVVECVGYKLFRHSEIRKYYS